MINKQFILGTVLGIFIGVSSSSFAYYSSYTNLTELTAGDLEDIVESAVGSCSTLTITDLMLYCSD